MGDDTYPPRYPAKGLYRVKTVKSTGLRASFHDYVDINVKNIRVT